MSKAANILKPLVPVFSVCYGLALIYLTALPTADGDGSFPNEAAGWIITLGAILLTLFVAIPLQRKIYPESRQFSLKIPSLPEVAGVLLLAPSVLLLKEMLVYGITLLDHPVQTELLTSTADEMREDLLAGVHAVFLAPVLEELCFRHLSIPPFRRFGTRLFVCVLMAVLFGFLHVRNFVGASVGGLLYGLVFLFSKNIWYAILLHAGGNLTGTLYGVFSFLGLGEVQASEFPAFFIPDYKIAIASAVLAVIGVLLLVKGLKKH